jgi:hypothetical protein
MTDKPTINRRRFVGGGLAGLATVTIVPRHVVAGSSDKPPSEKLNIAGVGVGGMGSHNLSMCSAENIVALCDVDPENYARNTLAKYPKAQRYMDFRVMLDRQKDIDAVIVATPITPMPWSPWRPSSAASTSMCRNP